MEKPDQQSPSREKLTASLDACLANGIRLLEDADWISHLEPPSTAFMLAVIAQEEFAKAFFLSLVRGGILPWSPLLLRAMNDHACKHLVGVLIEYADPQWEELSVLEAIYKEESELGDHRMPAAAGSALEILKYEKMDRWAGQSWSWAEDPAYDREVLRIAKGSLDKQKQDALYVRIGRDGSLAKAPNALTRQQAEAEIKKAERYRWSIYSLAKDDHYPSYMFQKLQNALKILFKPE